MFAKKQNLWISDLKAAKAVSAAVLDEEPVGFFSEFPVTGEIPCELQRLADGERFEGKLRYGAFLERRKEPVCRDAAPDPTDRKPWDRLQKRYTAGDGRAGSFKSTAKLSCVDTQHFAAASIDLKKKKRESLRSVKSMRFHFVLIRKKN